jgi:hypothetical protein
MHMSLSGDQPSISVPSELIPWSSATDGMQVMGIVQHRAAFRQHAGSILQSSETQFRFSSQQAFAEVIIYADMVSVPLDAP